MHIEEWNEEFLSRLDPKEYVEMLKKARVKSAMIYANSHVGYCYWPTKTGHMHKGLKGRDFLGEIIELCHKEGIDVIIYYSLIFNNWAYETHPEWRIVDIEGRASREYPGRAGRYGVCCPNAPGYREFVVSQIEELCENYDFEGIFFDMTFWPTVCYCQNCKRRYEEETGKELPTVIDWDDPDWILFQKKREEWLLEFAALATSTVKKLKPGVTVEHQYSTIAAPWIFAVTERLAEHCDYVGGDFYGGVLEQSFACKLYYNLTPRKPFEYMTSICFPNLADHTTVKPEALIEARAFMTLAHQGAFLIIDAIDPVGTLDERRYELIGRVYERLSRYEEFLGGELCQDIAIYFSFDSKFDFAEKGQKPSPRIFGRRRLPHVESALGATEALRTHHIPFGIISKRNLKDLSRHKVLILPNVLRLSDEEVEAIREYVINGGSVYASKFALRSGLAKVLGVDYLGETTENFTYIAPTQKGRALLKGITTQYPLSIPGSQVLAELPPKSDAEVLAIITLPYTDPDDASKFASIHSNPPGIPTDYPALVRKRLGKGTIIWCSAPIEAYATRYVKHRSVFMNIIRSLIKEPLSFEAEAPECVEILLFHDLEQKRYIINVINFQSEIGVPNVPIHDITVRVRVNGHPLSVRLLPEERSIPFKLDGEYAVIRIPTIRTFCMLALDYR